jgi:hypothetical protein
MVWTETVQLGAYEVEVTLGPTVSRPVRLGVKHPSGTHDQNFFLLEILFRQLRVCYFVASSLTRGRVCKLLLLLVLASAVTLGLPSLKRGQVCLLSSFCQYQSIASQYVHKIFTLSVLHSSGMYIQYIQGLFQCRLGTAVTSSLHYNGSFVT